MKNKNKILALLIASAVSVTLTTGCALISDSTTDENISVSVPPVPETSEETPEEDETEVQTEPEVQETEEPETQADETEQPEETEIAEETEENTETENTVNVRYSGISSETDMQAAAKELIGYLQAVEVIGCGGGVKFDSSNIIEVPYGDFSCEYAQTDDERFSTYDEVKQYIESSLTANMISKRYYNIFGGDLPAFRESDGILFVNIGGGKGGYSWKKGSDGDYIAEVTSDGGSYFDAATVVDVAGGELDMTIHIVNEGGVWKIDSLSDPYGA